MKTPPVRVLVVDDSALARRIIVKSLSADSGIEVVGEAVDPYDARDQMLQLKPDVITLDIEMPRMDGLTFLKLIVKHRPTPVVVMSSLSPAGSNTALEALSYGAIDVMGKPAGSDSAFRDGARLAEKIKAAARVDMKKWLAQLQARDALRAPVAEAVQPASSRNLILIGSSTGGTEALARVFRELPAGLPGICVVQHIPAGFSKAFADRMDRSSALMVREAESGDVAAPGTALIAPGGTHMVLTRSAGQYVVELHKGPAVHYQRPAVDVLFNSAVRAGAAPRSLAMLLTGMGSDGAAGMLQLRQAGATTVAQDEATSVVYGMPREAVRLGAAERQAPLQAMAGIIQDFAARERRAGSPPVRAGLVG